MFSWTWNEDAMWSWILIFRFYNKFVLYVYDYISVGSLGKDGEESIVENVQVTNCTFNETNNGARIKTWPVINL